MRIVIAGAVVAALALIACLPLYAFPASDEPRAVDAVYVIGPPTGTRMALAEQMIADGLADTLVVSLVEDDATERAAMERAAELCDAPDAWGFTVLCSQPEPFTTRGEARWMRELVESYGWESVAVITIRPHLTRTRVITERCWDGDIAYIDSGESLAPWYWAYQLAYQTAGFVKVALQDGC
ncbi:ElyC/SanA/YdcF family protein [Demequina sp. SYSU T00068]|uniref:ElyC/SanA/YdcF family protein n=1 Tax=Demequina lignilytica TaxID=3051663 RepID=UPI0026397051|nr:ElyC/SanA/YdcF family protein [Demequina sp. SYSU T00068]MDN4490675.1 ElyC/SanA/YdcF family protein [Demequina sp. SYSU T00068]